MVWRNVAGATSDFRLAPSERKTRRTGLTGLEVLTRRLQTNSVAFYLRRSGLNGLVLPGHGLNRRFDIVTGPT